MPPNKYYKGKVVLLYVSHLSKQTFCSETASDASNGDTLGQNGQQGRAMGMFRGGMRAGGCQVN